MLFYLPSRAVLLHLHTDDDVEVLCFRGALLVIHVVHVVLGVVCVLDIGSGVVAIGCLVYAVSLEGLVQFLGQIILSLQIDHGTGFALLINKV